VNRNYSSVAARAGHRCEYCQAPEAVFNFPFEVEHIVPGQSGPELEANLALACRSCNLFKTDSTHAVDPETNQVVRLYHPRTDRWDEHFRLLPSGELEGRTTIGRATIEQLRLNTEAQVAARQLWMRLAVYPA
jgi:HNH endonuclease